MKSQSQRLPGQTVSEDHPGWAGLLVDWAAALGNSENHDRSI